MHLSQSVCELACSLLTTACVYHMVLVVYHMVHNSPFAQWMCCMGGTPHSTDSAQCVNSDVDVHGGLFHYGHHLSLHTHRTFSIV